MLTTWFSQHFQVIFVCASTVADEGESLSSYKAMCLEVKQLLEDGFEDKTLANLKDRLAVVQPQHLVRPLLVCLVPHIAFITCDKDDYTLLGLLEMMNLGSLEFQKQHLNEVSMIANLSSAFT